MEAKNFRIGNFVNAGFKNEKKRSTHEMTGSCILDLYANAEKGVFKYDPIPLTDEWMIKLGFIANPYQDRFELDGIYIDCDKTKGRMDLWESRTGVMIDYVHQLQNLFFALTGNDLEVKHEVSV